MKLPRGVRISTVLFAGVLVYFAVHAFVGQQGLLSWRAMSLSADALTTELADLEARRAELQSRVDRLKPGNVDPDLLEERAWSQLGLAAPDAIMVDLREPVPRPAPQAIAAAPAAKTAPTAPPDDAAPPAAVTASAQTPDPVAQLDDGAERP